MKPRGQRALTSRRHTVYVSATVFRLTKAAAKAFGMSWSDYVTGALAERLARDARVLSEPKGTP